MKKLLLIATILMFFASPAHAVVNRISLPDSSPLSDGGSIGGAKHYCYDLFPTTPDGDVVAGTDLYRISARSAFTVESVFARVNVVGTSSAVTIDINDAASTILSTKLTIDASENNSTTAATAAVISDTAIAANAVISVDVDSADSGNTAAGLEIQVCGYHD